MFGPDPSLSYSSAPPTPTRPRQNYAYHILLVEDNLINQKVLSKQLRGVGCTVYVANHGIEALDFLYKTKLWNDKDRDKDGSSDEKMELSLILMDLEMPIMDGLTCCRRIRDLQREGRIREHVPIIAVTANARTEQMEDAIDAGMVGFYFFSSTASTFFDVILWAFLTSVKTGRHSPQTLPHPRTNAENGSTNVKEMAMTNATTLEESQRPRGEGVYHLLGYHCSIYFCIFAF
jgi:CheY-like chemotaxis protein